jgi:nicotinamide riboside kinase
MKVYLVGAHSCGKSTLARYVSVKYNLPMITECARMILSEKELQIEQLRYDLDVADQYQEEIFNRQLVEESKYESFVSDRSFDNLAYAAQHTRILSKLINSSALQEYLTVLRRPNSFIFFVRPTKATLKDDGVRESINWDGLIAIDSKIHFLLEMYSLKYFQINTPNMQERIRLIDSTLSLSS